MTRIILQLDDTKKELLELKDSKELALQSTNHPAETLLVTKVNDAISRLRYYGLKHPSGFL